MAPAVPIHYFYSTLIPLSRLHSQARHHILFCSLTPFPAQSQEAHQEATIGGCFVSIRREQNKLLQPEMTYPRLRKNNSMKGSQQHLQESAQPVLLLGIGPWSTSAPLEGMLNLGQAQLKGNTRNNPSLTSTVQSEGLDTLWGKNTSPTQSCS